MDIVLAVSNYVGKMVSADGAAGSSGKMKILLLDSETVSCPTTTSSHLRLRNLHPPQSAELTVQ
jgi:hypothetical protein